MWSNLYVYYDIRSDKNYSSYLSTKEIIRIFESTGVLQLKHPMIFINIPPFPWMEISIAQTNNGDFVIQESSSYEVANLIHVVTSREIDQSLYTAILKEIAEQLNWEIILEEDDHGNKDIKI